MTSTRAQRGMPSVPSDLAKCVGMPLEETECGSTTSRNIPPGYNNNNDDAKTTIEAGQGRIIGLFGLVFSIRHPQLNCKSVGRSVCHSFVNEGKKPHFIELLMMYPMGQVGFIDVILRIDLLLDVFKMFSRFHHIQLPESFRKICCTTYFLLYRGKKSKFSSSEDPITETILVELTFVYNRWLVQRKKVTMKTAYVRLVHSGASTDFESENGF